MGRTGRSCHRAPPRRRLAEGELSGRLPTEPSLAADYRVSRQTVREAIRRLREAGQLTAERGRGTFVRAAAAASPAVARQSSLLAALEAPAAGCGWAVEGS